MMGFVQVNGTDILTPQGDALYLQGVGIGNWLLPEGYMFDMLKADGYCSPRGLRRLSYELIGPEAADAFWEVWLDTYFTRDDVVRLADDGFNSIRFAFDWKVLFDDRTMQPLNRGFSLLDQAIAWCKEFNIWVILDLHGAPGGQNGTNIDDGWGYPWLFLSERAQQRTCDIWKYIATRYKDEEAVLGYDLLNEPLPDEHNQYNHLLEPLYKRITAAIREVDKNHIIILEGVNWASDISALGEPFDDKLIYQFHKYWNETDTGSIQRFLDYQDKYKVPLWCGETGENNHEWYNKCSALLKKHNIGWNLWPHKKRGEYFSPYNINMPEEWSQVLHYSTTKERPALDVSKAAFDKLLVAIDIANCERDEATITGWLEPNA